MSVDKNSYNLNPDFIKVENTLYNKKFIKQIHCNDIKCSILVSKTRKFNDTLIECDRFLESECYNKLSNYVNNTS